MRTISYTMKLDMFGYRISNIDSPEGHLFNYKNDNARCPGIRMTIEECDDIDGFLRKFQVRDYENRRGVNYGEPFGECWRNTMLGESTPWKLANIGVRGHELELHYVNEKLYQECITDPKWDEAREEEGFGIEKCDFVEPYYGILELYKWERHNIPETVLRVETTSPHTGNVSTTRIQINPHGSVKVTEGNSDHGRILNFLNDYTDDEVTVNVTEYSW